MTWTAPETMHVDPERPHLGGYHRGGDPLSWYPALWEWLVAERGVRSVLDVGCGEGWALNYFQALGCRATGIDGIEQDRDDIVTHDFTQGMLVGPPVDLVWSCEFVEHVEERFMPNYLPTFAGGAMVLLTHALPGQGGHHHVNCREDDYWIGALAAIGYRFDESMTRLTRSLVRHGYYGWSGLAFCRTS